MHNPSSMDVVARLALLEGALRLPPQRLTRDIDLGLEIADRMLRGRQAHAWTGSGITGFWTMVRLLLRASGIQNKIQDVLRSFGRWLKTRNINPADYIPKRLLSQFHEFLVSPPDSNVRQAAMSAALGANLGLFAVLSAAEGYFEMTPGHLIKMQPRQAVRELEKLGIEIQSTTGATVFSGIRRILDKFSSVLSGALTGEDIFSSMVVESSTPGGSNRRKIFYAVGEDLRKKNKPFNPSLIISHVQKPIANRVLDEIGSKKNRMTQSLDAPFGGASDGNSLLDTIADTSFDQAIREDPHAKLHQVALKVIGGLKNQAMKDALSDWLAGLSNAEIMEKHGDKITLGSFKVSQTRVRDRIQEVIKENPALQQEFSDALSSSS